MRDVNALCYLAAQLTSLLALLLVVHGAIHGLGFATGFGLSTLPPRRISKLEGLAWLLAGLLLVSAAALLFVAPAWWWLPAACGSIISQALILGAWSDAKLGTVANVLIAVPALVAALKGQPSSFRSQFRRETAALPSRPQTLVQEAELAHLPEAVRAYLRAAGVVGKPHVHDLRARFRGQIRARPQGGWMPFRAEQVNAFAPAARWFYIESSLYGVVPFDGLHRYVGDTATMHIKALSLFTVADAKGPEMDQSETVTLFNDMCVLAPATLIDRRIRWQAIDLFSVRARFSNGGHDVSALLYFNPRNELVNFCSDDRYQSADGKSYQRYRWCTPLSDYREYDGVRVAARGEPFWATPDGELVYGRFELLALRYNVSPGSR